MHISLISGVAGGLQGPTSLGTFPTYLFPAWPRGVSAHVVREVVLHGARRLRDHVGVEPEHGEQDGEVDGPTHAHEDGGKKRLKRLNIHRRAEQGGHLLTQLGTHRSHDGRGVLGQLTICLLGGAHERRDPATVEFLEVDQVLVAPIKVVGQREARFLIETSEVHVAEHVTEHDCSHWVAGTPQVVDKQYHNTCLNI